MAPSSAGSSVESGHGSTGAQMQGVELTCQSGVHVSRLGRHRASEDATCIECCTAAMPLTAVVRPAMQRGVAGAAVTRGGVITNQCRGRRAHAGCCVNRYRGCVGAKHACCNRRLQMHRISTASGKGDCTGQLTTPGRSGCSTAPDRVCSPRTWRGGGMEGERVRVGAGARLAELATAPRWKARLQA